MNDPQNDLADHPITDNTGWFGPLGDPRRIWCSRVRISMTVCDLCQRARSVSNSCQASVSASSPRSSPMPGLGAVVPEESGAIRDFSGRSCPRNRGSNPSGRRTRRFLIRPIMGTYGQSYGKAGSPQPTFRAISSSSVQPRLLAARGRLWRWLPHDVNDIVSERRDEYPLVATIWVDQPRLTTARADGDLAAAGSVSGATA